MMIRAGPSSMIASLMLSACTSSLMILPVPHSCPAASVALVGVRKLHLEGFVRFIGGVAEDGHTHGFVVSPAANVMVWSAMAVKSPITMGSTVVLATAVPLTVAACTVTGNAEARESDTVKFIVFVPCCLEKFPGW